MEKIFSLLSGLLFAVGVSGCSLSFTQPSASADDDGLDKVNIPVVEAVESRLGSLPLSERLNGTVIVENQVALYPEINGRIVKVLAKNGDFVEAGVPSKHD